MDEATSIRPAEAAHFGALAQDWWNPRGASAMLHRLNPTRLAWLRAAVDRHMGGDETARRPLTGKRALDMGCGAGLLAEPLARLGAAVVAVDAAPENIAAARAHAATVGLTIDYRCGDTAAVADETFDLIASLEVIEHVADPGAFVAALAGALAPDGLLLLSTPNRTAWARFAMIGIGETFGQIPRGTHDWDSFITPDELTEMLENAGMRVIDLTGFAWNPLRGGRLTEDLSLDYLVTAVRA